MKEYEVSKTRRKSLKQSRKARRYTERRLMISDQVAALGGSIDSIKEYAHRKGGELGDELAKQLQEVVQLKADVKDKGKKLEEVSVSLTQLSSGLEDYKRSAAETLSELSTIVKNEQSTWTVPNAPYPLTSDNALSQLEYVVNKKGFSPWSAGALIDHVGDTCIVQGEGADRGKLYRLVNRGGESGKFFWELVVDNDGAKALKELGNLAQVVRRKADTSALVDLETRTELLRNEDPVGDNLIVGGNKGWKSPEGGTQAYHLVDYHGTEGINGVNCFADEAKKYTVVLCYRLKQAGKTSYFRPFNRGLYSLSPALRQSDTPTVAVIKCSNELNGRVYPGFVLFYCAAPFGSDVEIYWVNVFEGHWDNPPRRWVPHRSERVTALDIKDFVTSSKLTAALNSKANVADLTNLVTREEVEKKADRADLIEVQRHALREMVEVSRRTNERINAIPIVNIDTNGLIRRSVSVCEVKSTGEHSYRTEGEPDIQLITEKALERRATQAEGVHRYKYNYRETKIMYPEYDELILTSDEVQQVFKLGNLPFDKGRSLTIYTRKKRHWISPTRGESYIGLPGVRNDALGSFTLDPWRAYTFTRLTETLWLVWFSDQSKDPWA